MWGRPRAGPDRIGEPSRVRPCAGNNERWGMAGAWEAFHGGVLRLTSGPAVPTTPRLWYCASGARDGPPVSCRRHTLAVIPARAGNRYSPRTGRHPGMGPALRLGTSVRATAVHLRSSAFRKRRNRRFPARRRFSFAAETGGRMQRSAVHMRSGSFRIAGIALENVSASVHLRRCRNRPRMAPLRVENAKSLAISVRLPHMPQQSPSRVILLLRNRAYKW